MNKVNTMNRIRNVTVTVVVSALLSACTTMQAINRDVAKSNEITAATAEGYMSRPVPDAPVRGPIVTDAPFVDVRPVPVAPKYPAVFQKVLQFQEPVGVPVQVLARRIEDLTGIRVTYQSELVDFGAADPAAAAVPEAAVAVDSVLSQLPPVGQAAGALQVGGNRAVDVSTGVAINYNGAARGLFDTVAAAIGGYWRYDPVQNRVDLYRYLTETYRIAEVNGGGQSSAEVGNATSQEGEQISSGKAIAQHATEQSVWKGIEESIQRLLSSEGVYNIAPSLGVVVVRDRPDRVELVRNFVRDMNKALSRQVEFSVDVYRVMVRNSDVRGINWAAAFRAGFENTRYSAILDSLGSIPSNDGGNSQSIIRIRDEYNGRPQPWGGTSIILDALNTVGTASVASQARAVTTNNVATPIRVTRKIAYLRSTQQTVIGTGNNTTAGGSELTPGEVEVGLVMYLLPHVQEDGKRILMKMMVSLSTLERLDAFTSNGQTIQLPQVASREFQQSVWLETGETVVLAGFQQMDSDREVASPFSEGLWGLAGRRENAKMKEVVVIAVRPHVSAVDSRI